MSVKECEYASESMWKYISLIDRTGTQPRRPITYHTYVDMRRFATVSNGWKKKSSDAPATADPIIRADDFPDTCMGLVAVTVAVGLSSLRCIILVEAEYDRRKRDERDWELEIGYESVCSDIDD